MKKLVVLSLSLFLGWTMSAQDIITMNDGTDIQAKVTEVGQSEVKYKRFSNLDGPTYTINISDILMITYQNGEREMYNTKKTESTQQETKYRAAIPKSVMTYNSWTGMISVDGKTVPRGTEEMYFYPDDYQLFQGGKTISIFGGILEVLGAFPFGYGIGSLAFGNDSRAVVGMAIGGGVSVLSGVLISLLGESKKKTAISNYNADWAFQPDFHFGETPNGIGLAIVF